MTLCGSSKCDLEAWRQADPSKSVWGGAKVDEHANYQCLFTLTAGSWQWQEVAAALKAATEEQALGKIGAEVLRLRRDEGRAMEAA
ncbi:hypothetical protein V8C86DRAFT_3105502 [Haematococcus lacustris]